MGLVGSERDELHRFKAHAQEPRRSAHCKVWASLMIGQFCQGHGFTKADVYVATVEDEPKQALEARGGRALLGSQAA